MAVSALIRRLEAAGGGAMVLAKGDATAGALLVLLSARGVSAGARERVLDQRGIYRWSSSGPADPAELDAYVARRRRSDPDLWVVELDHPEAEIILAEMIGES